MRERLETTPSKGLPQALNPISRVRACTREMPPSPVSETKRAAEINESRNKLVEKGSSGHSTVCKHSKGWKCARTLPCAPFLVHRGERHHAARHCD
jgi:hypothetical protein